jgi:hypothetical protein
MGLLDRARVSGAAGLDVALRREQIWPLETLDLDRAQIDRALAPLQEQVRERGLWAARLMTLMPRGGRRRASASPGCSRR